MLIYPFRGLNGHVGDKRTEKGRPDFIRTENPLKCSVIGRNRVHLLCCWPGRSCSRCSLNKRVGKRVIVGFVGATLGKEKRSKRMLIESWRQAMENDEYGWGGFQLY